MLKLSYKMSRQLPRLLVALCVICLPVYGSKFKYARRYLMDNFPNSACRNNQADILFLLDMSHKVGHQNFEREKDLVRDVANHISIGHEHYQIAVGTYSTAFHPDINFHFGSDKATLNRKINSLRYIPGQRAINLALNGARTALIEWTSGERAFAAKVIFLVTSGPSTSKYIDESQIASLLRNYHNITIFVIGVTPEAKAQNVIRMTANDKHYFYVDDFRNLTSLPDGLLTTLCQDVILHNRCFDQTPVCNVLPCSGTVRDITCPKTCGSCTDIKPEMTSAPQTSTTPQSSTTQQTSTTPQTTSTTQQTSTTPQTTSTTQQTTSTTQQTSTTQISTTDTPMASQMTTSDHTSDPSPMTSTTKGPSTHWIPIESKTTANRSEWITVPYRY